MFVIILVEIHKCNCAHNVKVKLNVKHAILHIFMLMILAVQLIATTLIKVSIIKFSKINKFIK